MCPDHETTLTDLDKLAEEIGALEVAATAHGTRLRERLAEFVERTTSRSPAPLISSEVLEAEYRQAHALNEEVTALSAINKELADKWTLLRKINAGFGHGQAS